MASTARQFVSAALAHAMSTDPEISIDAETVRSDGRTWQGHSARTQVVAGWQWVHLARVSAPSYMVLLKISPNADEHDAVRALEWWLQSPGREDGDVVEVL
jgi:hypothetical protein